VAAAETQPGGYCLLRFSGRFAGARCALAAAGNCSAAPPLALLH